MKQSFNWMKRAALFLTLTLMLAAFAGCSRNGGGASSESGSAGSSASVSQLESSIASDGENGGKEEGDSAPEESGSPAESTASGEETEGAEGGESAAVLSVRFGNGGTSFPLYLYNNSTAEAIAHHVGTAGWQLPIYHYDDYENWEVMQYYDIPNRYEIPSNTESVTSEAAGTVYYSEPNRILLFFHEAEVSGEYTPVGYFDNTDEFVAAVVENPVLEGWGNKLVFISPGE